MTAYATKIYANAVAKYNTGKLLDKEQIRRLVDAEFLDAVKILIDFGYGGGVLDEKSYDIDAFISEETARLIEYVTSDSPCNALSRCLLNRFYYNNAKAYYKNRFIDVDFKAALYKMEDDDLRKAVELKDYSSLSDEIATAFKELDDLFSDATADPRTIDLILTKAMYRDNLNCAKQCKSKDVMKFVLAEIDFSNIMAMLRCKALSLSEGAAAEMIIEGGLLPRDDLLDMLTRDLASTALMLYDTAYSDAASVLSSSEDMVRMETGIDDHLYLLISAQQDNMLSLSPFISYFIAQLTEFKTVKMVLVCLKNHARDQILKRLRNLYN